MIQGLAIACSICKFTFPYDYTRKYSQLLAQRKQRETLPPLPLYTHTQSPHRGIPWVCGKFIVMPGGVRPQRLGTRGEFIRQWQSSKGREREGSRVERGREGGPSGSPGSNWCRKVYFPSALWLRLGHCEMFALFSLLARGRVEHKARRECWLGLAPARYLHFAEPKDIGMWCRQDVPANDT